MGPGIEDLQDAGIELLGFARTDEDVPHRADYRYLAVWAMPEGEDQTRLLEKTLEEAGWNEYFDQINARGETVDPQMVLQDMAQVDEVPVSSLTSVLPVPRAGDGPRPAAQRPPRWHSTCPGRVETHSPFSPTVAAR